VRLKNLLDSQLASLSASADEELYADDSDYDRLIEHYLKENSLLEQKSVLLAKEIFDENLSLIQLQVDLAMKKFVES
jgi:RalA-binding protein 1